MCDPPSVFPTSAADCGPFDTGLLHDPARTSTAASSPRRRATSRPRPSTASRFALELLYVHQLPSTAPLCRETRRRRRTVSIRTRCRVDRARRPQHVGVVPSGALCQEEEPRRFCSVACASRLSRAQQEHGAGLLSDADVWRAAQRPGRGHRMQQIFSCFDLYSGFWQVPVPPEERDKTAFVTHNGLFGAPRCRLVSSTHPQCSSA